MSKKARVAAMGLVLAVASAACGGRARPELQVSPIVHAGAVYQNPLDAVPGAGGAVYFTADGSTGPGVFVAPSNHVEPRALALGRPFGRPVGLAVSADDRSVFVADAQADAVFSVPVAGGPPVVLPGSAGLAPRGLEVKGEQLYLTGVDPATGRPAVLVMPASGGQPKVLAATGLVLPDGIAVGDDGSVFVTDRFQGTVSRVADGTPTPLVSDLTLGQPAGVALSVDGSGLLVSALSPRGTAQVLLLDLASRHTRTFDAVIGANHGAGGLHKAHDGRSYAWCDGSRSGRVYRIEP